MKFSSASRLRNSPTAVVRATWRYQMWVSVNTAECPALYYPLRRML